MTPTLASRTVETCLVVAAIPQLVQDAVDQTYRFQHQENVSPRNCRTSCCNHLDCPAASVHGTLMRGQPTLAVWREGAVPNGATLGKSLQHWGHPWQWLAHGTPTRFHRCWTTFPRTLTPTKHAQRRRPQNWEVEHGAVNFPSLSRKFENPLLLMLQTSCQDTNQTRHLQDKTTKHGTAGHPYRMSEDNTNFQKELLRAL